MEIATITKESYLSDEMIRKFKKLFSTDEEYAKHLRNLNATTRGLCAILEERQDLKDVLYPQFHTINSIVDALLMDEGFQHPCFTPRPR